MRMWHWKLLPYLPDAQLKGQKRELIAILRNWRDKGEPGHLLVNRVTEYPRDELCDYMITFNKAYARRFGKSAWAGYEDEIAEFGTWDAPVHDDLYSGWHDEGYLEVCMMNLWEKYRYGRGKSRITEAEWRRLCEGFFAGYMPIPPHVRKAVADGMSPPAVCLFSAVSDGGCL